MSFRKTTIVTALFSLALTLSLVPHSSGQSKKRSTPQPVPAAPTCASLLTFAPAGELNIAWNGMGQILVVTAGNTGDRKLSAKLSDLSLKNITGDNLQTPDVINVEPAQSTMGSGQRLQVTSTIKKANTVAPGVYVGNLLLELEGNTEPKKCAYQLPVKLTVPDGEPLIDKVTLRQYRPLPVPLPFRQLSCFWYDCVVPLRGHFTSLKELPRREVPLGLIQNENGHTAVVYQRDQQATGKEGVIELPLDVEGWAFAGTYEGQLRSKPSGNKADNVQLKLIVTDWFLWPILVIALSMWLGRRAQRYLNVERILWQLRREEAELGVAFQENQRRFAKAATGTSYAAYSVTEALARARQALRESLSALRGGTTLDASNERYNEVLTELESLRTQVAAWGGFAEELAALRKALRKDSDLGDPPSGFENKTPVLFTDYGALFEGRKLTTLTELTTIREQVSQATKAAGLWFELNGRLSAASERYLSLKGSESSMSAEEKEALAGAWDELLATRLKLWEVKNIAAPEEFSAPIETVETTLRKLAAKYGGPHPPGPSVALADFLMSRGNLSMSATASGLEARPDDEPLSDAERAQHYANATKKWDRRLTFLAFLIATLTALNQYYLGKAFGTFKDYMGLLLLGLGTKLTVDIVSAAVGWLSQNRQNTGIPKPNAMT